MKNVAFIPARAGSKGLKKKNFLELSGRTVIEFTIRCAQRAEVFDEIWVISDSPLAERIAANCEVGFMLEPIEMAGDFVSSTVPVIWGAEELGLNLKDRIWNLQPTSPLRTPADLVEADRCFNEKGARFVTSTTQIDPHYFHWALKENGVERELWFPEFLVERHLLPVVHRPNGAIKAGSLGDLKEEGSVFAKGLVGCPMPDARSIHIREDWDMKLAQLYLETYPGEFEWVL